MGQGEKAETANISSNAYVVRNAKVNTTYDAEVFLVMTFNAEEIACGRVVSHTRRLHYHTILTIVNQRCLYYSLPRQKGGVFPLDIPHSIMRGFSHNLLCISSYSHYCRTFCRTHILYSLL